MDCKKLTEDVLAYCIECIWWVWSKCGGLDKCKECGKVKEK